MDDIYHDNYHPRPLIVRLKQLNGEIEFQEWEESNYLLGNKQSVDKSLLAVFQKFLENGCVLLDMQETDFRQITLRIAEQMVFDGHLQKCDIENVSKVLLLTHHSEESLASEEDISDGISSKDTEVIDIEKLIKNRGTETSKPDTDSNNFNTETALVMVANVDFLLQPTMVFVRLKTAVCFSQTKDYEYPVRFMCILLGPIKESFEYLEIGKCICAVLHDEEVVQQAYNGKTKNEVGRAIQNFYINREAIPVDDKVMKNKEICKEECNNLLKGLTYKKYDSFNPLIKTNRLWGGLINDVTRRIPKYKSDISDGFNRQIIAASIFLYFGVLSTAITFGGLMSSKTQNLMGISETLLSTSMVGIVFHLLSSQPLIIIGGTGPLLLFDEALFQLCKLYAIDFLTVRIYIGLWLGLIAVVIAAFDGCVYLRLLTRFTQELFASLISLIFMMEAIFRVVEVFKTQRVLAEYNDNTTDIYIREHTFEISENITTERVAKAEAIDQPNTALFCAILSVGTFVLAYCLRVFRNSHFLGRNIRRAVGDFGVPISISAFVYLSYLVSQIYTEKLIVPEGISPTDPKQRSWIIPFIDLPVWIPFVSFIAAMLVYILIFMETQISELILDSRGLRKGSGFHVDIVIISLMNVACGFLGMPWQSGATIRSVTHASAVTVISDSEERSDKSQVLIVKEQRVSGFIISLMVGLSVIMAPILRIIPVSILYGVFFYMGIVSISGVQFMHRIRLLFTPTKYHGSEAYVKRVQTWKMHIFTIIQIIALCLLWLVKSSRFSLALPFVLVMMIPLRQKMCSYFSKSEMAALDGNLPEIKAEDEPDFYEQSHLPA